jgi:hypothetical protein
MDDTLALPLEKRLADRYITLVKQHQHACPAAAAGPSAGAAGGSALAATQALWRFLGNDRVTLAALAEPLIRHGRSVLADQADVAAALAVHDWSKLSYSRHTGKRDVVALTHERDVGYELATVLLVSGVDGSPIAPMQMYLKSAAASMAGTGPEAWSSETARLEQVLPTMKAAKAWALPQRLVHVIDREADSVGHYRQWDQAGQWFLVRADDRRVCWRNLEGQEESILLSQIDQRMQAGGQLRDVREVPHQGKPCRQWVGQTEVTLDRPARHRVKGRQCEVPGPPLTVRLVISHVCDGEGTVLATWWLLTNVPQEQASDETVALWYYWRWRIESFFQLLKSGGQQVEAWQQETALAIARRLLIASMACVLAWDLQRDNSPEGKRMQQVLVRLSGRQMKRARPVTASALLAGLFVLLPMLALLEEHDNDPAALIRLAKATLPYFASG